MKRGILKRVIALCIAGGVMAFSLAACGDSEENNEGTGTVQDVSQDAAREDEDGTVGGNENEDTVNVDSSGNDVRVAHASSSGNSGNGFAIPVFKPGEEPDSGQELQPGEEPQPGAGSKPGTGTQSSTGSQSSTGAPSGAGTQQPQQPQPSAGTQQPQQPQPSAGTQQPQQPQPSAGTQQPQQPQPNSGNQQPQPTKPSSGTQTSGGTQSGTGTQTAHTHSFKGGNCSTPATCSCGATGDYGSHNWVTKTIHHEATWHDEKRTFKEQVIVGYTEKIKYYWCDQCLIPQEISDFNYHYLHTGHLAGTRYRGGDPIYEEQEVVRTVRVTDSEAWDENITTCSICSARQ